MVVQGKTRPQGLWGGSAPKPSKLNVAGSNPVARYQERGFLVESGSVVRAFVRERPVRTGGFMPAPSRDPGLMVSPWSIHPSGGPRSLLSVAWIGGRVWSGEDAREAP